MLLPNCREHLLRAVNIVRARINQNFEDIGNWLPIPFCFGFRTQSPSSAKRLNVQPVPGRNFKTRNEVGRNVRAVRLHTLTARPQIAQMQLPFTPREAHRIVSQKNVHANQRLRSHLIPRFHLILCFINVEKDIFEYGSANSNIWTSKRIGDCFAIPCEHFFVLIHHFKIQFRRSFRTGIINLQMHKCCSCIDQCPNIRFANANLNLRLMKTLFDFGQSQGNDLRPQRLPPNRTLMQHPQRPASPLRTSAIQCANPHVVSNHGDVLPVVGRDILSELLPLGAEFAQCLQLLSALAEEGPQIGKIRTLRPTKAISEDHDVYFVSVRMPEKPQVGIPSRCKVASAVGLPNLPKQGFRTERRRRLPRICQCPGKAHPNQGKGCQDWGGWHLTTIPEESLISPSNVPPLFTTSRPISPLLLSPRTTRASIVLSPHRIFAILQASRASESWMMEQAFDFPWDWASEPPWEPPPSPQMIGDQGASFAGGFTLPPATTPISVSVNILIALSPCDFLQTFAVFNDRAPNHPPSASGSRRT